MKSTGGRVDSSPTAPSGWLIVVDLIVGFVPIVGDVKDFQEACTGYNPVTGESLNGIEQSVALVSVAIPFVSGSLARFLFRARKVKSANGLRQLDSNMYPGACGADSMRELIDSVTPDDFTPNIDKILECTGPRYEDLTINGEVVGRSMVVDSEPNIQTLAKGINEYFRREGLDLEAVYKRGTISSYGGAGISNIRGRSGGGHAVTIKSCNIEKKAFTIYDPDSKDTILSWADFYKRRHPKPGHIRLVRKK